MKKVFLLYEFLELLEAFRHEEKFQGESVLAGVFVKLGKKGIVCKLFKHEARIEMLGKQVCQRGFSGAYVSFNSYEIIFQSQLVGAAK